MLELVFCSLFTILPDYLYRHYKQGKRLGHECPSSGISGHLNG